MFLYLGKAPKLSFMSTSNFAWLELLWLLFDFNHMPRGSLILPLWSKFLLGTTAHPLSQQCLLSSLPHG